MPATGSTRPACDTRREAHNAFVPTGGNARSAGSRHPVSSDETRNVADILSIVEDFLSGSESRFQQPSISTFTGESHFRQPSISTSTNESHFHRAAIATSTILYDFIAFLILTG
jgi:hypothetical protein